MKISARLKKFLLITVTVLFMSAIAVTFAQFFYENELPATGGTGEVKIEFDNVTLDATDIFKEKGDTYTYNFDVKNTGTAAFFYTIDFAASGGSLQQAVLLYLDGEFLGTVYSVVGAEKSIAIPYPLYPSESVSHEIKFEYHIGANGYFAIEDSDFAITIGASARQLLASSDKYLFASSIYELEQILNNYNYENYTVRLTGNITLDKSIVIAKPLNIDFGGHTLNLNDNTLTFSYADSSPSQIFNSRIGGGITYGDYGEIIVNLPNSYLLDRTKSVNLTITSASVGAVRTAYSNYLDGVFKKGIRAGDDLKGLFGVYIDHFGATFFDNLGLINPTTLVITAPDYTALTNLSISFPDTAPIEYDVKIWGGETAADTIIEENFFFVGEDYFADNQTVTDISGDIFLPTIARNSESPIKWISSNREVLTEEGKFSAPYNDTNFDLSAVISVNGVNILKTFKIKAIAKTPEEKMREISILHDILVFTQTGDTRGLFKAEDFAHMGLTSLTYTLPAAIANIFDLDNQEATIELKESTDIENTYLIVTGIFGTTEVSATVSIKINILSNISFQDAAYRNIMIALSAIPESTLDGFALPSDYKTHTTIEYFVIPGEVGPYFNPMDVQDFVKVRQDGGLDIVVEKLPREDTTITIKVEITHEDVTDTRYFQFGVSGVIHYADDDIADINLYQELRRKYDTNNDWIITAQEAANPTGDNTGTFVASNHNITSLKGIEYFTTLTDVDLSSNNITDLSPLAALTGIEKLILNNNLILDTDPLKPLNNLVQIDLAYNLITNINSLKNKNAITTLILNNNNFLGDLTALSYMPSLRSVNITTTLATSSELVKNINVIVTANQNSVDAGNGNISFSGAVINVSNYAATNRIVNAIMPIYEFHNVIYLPPTIVYNNTSYDITWGVSHPDIVNFDENNRAYIVMPIADVDIKLSAQVTNGAYTINRYFDVLSVGDDSLPSMIYVDGQSKNSAEVIPDERLRYYLIDKFDTNGDKNLDATEMSKVGGELDLSGKGIKDLTGLGYFKDIIGLDLRNNDFTDITALQQMTNLTTLRIDGEIDNLEVLLGLTTFSVLQVFGMKDINTDASLATLYQIYLNNPSINIYKDSLNTTWDAYLEPLATALKKLEGIYLLNAGAANKQDLTMTVTAVMYNGDKVNLDVTYAKASGQYTIVTNNSIQLNYNAMPAQDEYGRLNATVSIGTTSVTRELTVISVYDTELYVEKADGSFELLHIVVPNEVARRTFIGQINNTTGASNGTYLGKAIKYLPRASYIGLTTITFTGQGLHGVKGLELLKGSTTLHTVAVNGYMTKSEYAEGSVSDTIFTNSGYLSLDILNSTDYPALRTVTVNNSVIDLFELKNLSELTTLTVNNSTKVVMDITVAGVRQSIFSHLKKLTNLTITTSQVRDFWAVQKLEKAVYLRLQGNPLANITLTDYYVGLAYNNVFGQAIDYRIVDANTAWIPKAADISDLGVTFVTSGNAVTPYPQAVTYLNFQGSGIAINFPNRYSSSEDNIEWTASVGGGTYTVSGTQFTFTVPSNVTTITRIKGRVYIPNSTPRSYIAGAEVEYVFVSIKAAGTTGFTGSPSVLDINYAFMENNQFVDYRFAMYALGLAAENGTTGTFTKAAIEAVTQMHNNAPNGATATESFYNIKGIRYFTKLTSIRFGYHMISDISEIYHLTALKSLRMYYNRIESLWVTEGGEQRSVFYQTPDLNELQLYYNPQINDFLPISHKTPTVERDAADLQNLNTINIYQAGATYFPDVIRKDDPQNVLRMIKTWWSKRKSINTTVSLNVVNSNMGTYALVESFFEAVAALETVTVPAQVSVDTALPIVASFGGKDYPLTWAVHGTNNNVVVSSAGLVQSISAELSGSNHTVRVKVQTLLPTTTIQVVRLIELPIYIQGNRDDSDLWVEVTQLELSTAYSAYASYAQPYKNLRNQADNYILPADKIIPDPTLRNFIFYTYDKINNGNNNGVLDITDISNRERNRTSAINLTNRFIDDISGLELFNEVAIWYVDHSNMTQLPQLYIRADSKLERIRLRYSYDLADLSNLTFDGDGVGTTYVSLANKLTYFEINDTHSLSDEQFTHIANMTKLESLNISGVRIANLDVFHPLYKTINFFNVSNNTIYTNNNRTQYKRLVLDSQNGLTLNNFRYESYILKDIIRLDAYPADGTSRELPSSFKLPGYDKEYGIKWIAIADNNYTISQSNGKYYITISAGAELTIPIRAQATYIENSVEYFTWSEELDIITLQDSGAGELYHRTDGTIEINGETKNIVDFVPDPIIRYLLYLHFDDGDGHLGASELASLTTLSINNNTLRISSLEGLQYITGLETFTLNYIYTDDLSTFGKMDSLVNLTINALYMLIRDTSMFGEMDNLAQLTVGVISSIGVGLHNYNFLMENDNIVRINSIYNTTSGGKTALYSRNSYAYARMYNQFSDIGSQMGDATFINTQDEKYASTILNAIDIALKGNSKTELATTDNKIVLPSSVTYQGKTYAIEWVRMSNRLSIDENNELTVQQDSLETIYNLVARIKYFPSDIEDGKTIEDYSYGCYERLFQVRYQGA